MNRSLLAAAGVTLALSAGLGPVGCQVAPLPEGYSWDVRPANDLAYAPKRTGHARGLNASRVDRTNASTARGGRAYSFASALPGTSRSGAGSPAPASSASSPDLSPPAPLSSPAARDLFADEDGGDFFGSPAGGGPAYEVVVAPTPVAGRNAGIVTHTIRRGDNLWKIAETYYGSGLRYQEILRANPGINPDRLKLGDRLVLPGIAR